MDSKHICTIYKLVCTLTNPTDQPFYSDAVCIVVTLYHNNYYYWIKDSDNSY